MDSSLDPTLFTIRFLGATFVAALVAGLAGFAFGLVAAAVWLYIMTPLQMNGQIHLVVGVVEAVVDIFCGEDQAHHLDEGAARKSEHGDV